MFLNKLFFPQVISAVITIPYMVQVMNMSYLEYTRIFAISLLVSSILEMPSGYFSDRIGRKKALIVGNIIYLLGILLFILQLDFQLSLFAYIIVIPTGITIASGNFEVLIYESAVNSENNNEPEIKERFTSLSIKYFSYGLIFSSFAGLIATFSFSIAPYLPFIIEMFIISIQLLSYLSFEENIIKTKKYSLFIKKNLFKNSLESLRKIKLVNIYPVVIISFFSILFIMSRISFEFYQPIINEYGFDIKVYGVILTILNLAALGISIIIKNKSFNIHKIYVVSLLVFILQFCIIIPVFFNTSMNVNFVLMLITFIPIQLIRIIVEGYGNFFINQSMDIEKFEFKTTIFSFYATFKKIGFILLLLLVGSIQNILGEFTTTYIIIMSIIALSLSIIYFIGFRRCSK